MAKDARMLHLAISKSLQVDSLPLAARLLFTWMIPHADDDGRMKGDPKYVKGSVVPLTNWSIKNIQSYLEMMKNTGLIYYWQENGAWFIEFAKWNMYQHIRPDRYKLSDLPSFHEVSDNQSSTIQQPADNQKAPQSNTSESNEIEVNKGEANVNKAVADKYPSRDSIFPENPRTFEPTSKEETAALEVWELLEPGNPFAFRGTYLKACKNGLPAAVFYQFSSEIKQDPTIKNKGAIFNKKVSDYLNGVT